MSRFRPFETRGGMPAELYHFTLGAAVLGAWTSGTLWRDGDWRPVPIRRERIETNDERSAGSLRVILPADHGVTNAVVDLYRGTVPTGVVELTVYRVHQGQVAFAKIFVGEVAAAEFSGSHCLLTVESKAGALKQRVLRQLYQGPCNNTLYDSFCGVVRANFSAAATVTAIASDGVTLTVPVASSQANGYYTGGQLQFGSRWGFITAHTGSTLVLLRSVPGLAVSSSVTISAGCDRQIGTCHTKFNNIANHQGFPFIPSLDPFTAGVGKTTP
jgi:uncharacterized phage protein (TIGR02218 family)